MCVAESEQHVNPVSPPPPLSFEGRLSRLRAWTLIPTYYGPLFIGSFIRAALGLSEYVSGQMKAYVCRATEGS